MAYIIESLKKVNFRTHRKKEHSKKWHEEDKMVILTAIIISVDYALVIKFIEILKSL